MSKSTTTVMKEMAGRILELRVERDRLHEALERIRDQNEPQRPTATWARDVAAQALSGGQE